VQEHGLLHGLQGEEWSSRVSDLAFKEVGLYIIEVDWAMQYSRSSRI
jgi:hypothetical protein